MMTRLIVDTDFETDCDDAGALAVLHGLADCGKVEILGINGSICSPLPAAGICAFNRAFNRARLPVGCNRSVANGPVYRALAEKLRERMYHGEMARQLAGEIVPEDSFSFYTRLLENAPDHSVTICAIGLLSSLAELLQRGAGELIRRKVVRLVTMAEAACPDGKDGFNWNMDRHSAEIVLREWPGPIVVTALGGDVLTSAVPCGTTPRAEMLRIAYRRMGGGDVSYRRSSWDQIAVLCAADMLGSMAALSEPGDICYCPESGEHHWSPGNGRRSFLLPKASPEELAAFVQDWMIRACKDVQEA